MLGIESKAVRYVWTAALVLLALTVVFLVRKTLFVFTVAILLAYLLSPLVDLLDRVLPARQTRGTALALAYLMFVGGMILIGTAIGSQVVQQANALSRRLPHLMAQWQQPAAQPPDTSIQGQVVEKIKAEIGQRSSDLLAALPEAGLKLLTMASDLIYIVIVPVLAFFFLKDAHLIRDAALELVRAGPQRELLDDLMADVHLLLAHYMRALVLLSSATFAAYGLAFWILGVPYGALLAAVAFFLEFIPMLGPLTAGVAIVAVTALSGGHVAAVVIFLIAYRFVQDYGLSPHLMGHGVELHPLLVLLGVFGGAEVAGIPGTFLSVPVLALFRITFIRIRKARAAAHASVSL
jgi:predicted PurR-regulated permease PerM